jgi:hypothetical protein
MGYAHNLNQNSHFAIGHVYITCTNSKMLRPDKTLVTAPPTSETERLSFRTAKPYSMAPSLFQGLASIAGHLGSLFPQSLLKIVAIATSQQRARIGTQSLMPYHRLSTMKIKWQGHMVLFRTFFKLR